MRFDAFRRYVYSLLLTIALNAHNMGADIHYADYADGLAQFRSRRRRAFRLHRAL